LDLVLGRNPEILKFDNNMEILVLEDLFVRDFMNFSNLNFEESVMFLLSMRLMVPTAPNSLELKNFS